MCCFTIYIVRYDEIKSALEHNATSNGYVADSQTHFSAPATDLPKNIVGIMGPSQQSDNTVRVLKCIESRLSGSCGYLWWLIAPAMQTWFHAKKAPQWQRLQQLEAANVASSCRQLQHTNGDQGEHGPIPTPLSETRTLCCIWRKNEQLFQPAWNHDFLSAATSHKSSHTF